MTKRLFLAIKIQPDSQFADSLIRLKGELNHENIKWVDQNNLHITLKFFGETAENKIPDIVNALKFGLENHQNFGLEISTLGIFGSSYNPKLIWAGLRNTEPLIKLVTSVNSEIEKIGFYQDRQNFVPHLTLGRIKNLSDKNLFQDIISDYKEEYFQEAVVKEVCLFESTLTREGPTYKVIEKYELK